MTSRFQTKARSSDWMKLAYLGSLKKAEVATTGVPGATAPPAAGAATAPPKIISPTTDAIVSKATRPGAFSAAGGVPTRDMPSRKNWTPNNNPEAFQRPNIPAPADPVPQTGGAPGQDHNPAQPRSGIGVGATGIMGGASGSPVGQSDMAGASSNAFHAGSGVQKGPTWQQTRDQAVSGIQGMTASATGADKQSDAVRYQNSNVANGQMSTNWNANESRGTLLAADGNQIGRIQKGGDLGVDGAGDKVNVRIDGKYGTGTAATRPDAVLDPTGYNQSIAQRSITEGGQTTTGVNSINNNINNTVQNQIGAAQQQAGQNAMAANPGTFNTEGPRAGLTAGDFGNVGTGADGANNTYESARAGGMVSAEDSAKIRDLSEPRNLRSPQMVDPGAGGDVGAAFDEAANASVAQNGAAPGSIGTGFTGSIQPAAANAVAAAAPAPPAIKGASDKVTFAIKLAYSHPLAFYTP